MKPMYGLIVQQRTTGKLSFTAFFEEENREEAIRIYGGREGFGVQKLDAVPGVNFVYLSHKLPSGISLDQGEV